MNADGRLKRPCSECVLMQLVAAEFRDKQIASRNILLNEQHETVQSLYQCVTPEELEAAAIEWLMNNDPEAGEGTI
jgi:hypothetical protein